jgi:hypothetical protein
MLPWGITGGKRSNVCTCGGRETANRDAFFVKQAVEPRCVATALHYLFGPKAIDQYDDDLLLLTQTQGVGKPLQREKPRCEHVANVP